MRLTLKQFINLLSEKHLSVNATSLVLLTSNQSIRVNYPVPVHHASTHPLGTKKLPVLNLEMLETSMMA